MTAKQSTDNFIIRFFKLDAAGGILLFICALLAIVVANSPLEPYYKTLLSTAVEIRVGAFEIAKPLLLWVNDGLMAVFFFLVGLELKRELVEGELADRRNIILPGVGAVGGMLAPALIYAYFNYKDPIAIQGWAIPAATDIAFALGVLKLLGPRVPTSVKLFLTSLAIFDDIGAIIIIALFYTSKISFTALIVVGICIPFLATFNRCNINAKSPYLLIGLIMWAATLKSGVHATLAGVVLAMFIPLSSASEPNYSPLKRLERDLEPLVAFFVLPVFAFANAGINLWGISSEQVFHNVSIGTTLGLLVGKQVGIFVFCYVFIKLNITKLPSGINWITLYGVSTLCGIGFTMSLFIGSLAFEDVVNKSALFDERLGIIVGSIASGILGYIILRLNLKPSNNQA